ncbi:MAG TPA: aminotransferase class I/II-fold pyridoxal phosphate-dependent enzyme, partial [Thermomicrobiales bacterium]
MDIRLDREEATPLYRQIVAQVLAQIEDGRLPRGSVLPPERTLAAHLRVNRSTIVAAYQDLVATGLVEARVGRGTWISGPERHTPAPFAWSSLFSPTLERLQLSGQRDLLGTLQLPGRRAALRGCPQPRTVALGTGAPDPALFPRARFRQALEQALADDAGELFGYGPVQGVQVLRAELAAWMARQGIRSSAERVVVVQGSQQGLDLLARLFIEPGDAIV